MIPLWSGCMAMQNWRDSTNTWTSRTHPSSSPWRKKKGRTSYPFWMCWWGGKTTTSGHRYTVNQHILTDTSTSTPTTTPESSEAQSNASGIEPTTCVTHHHHGLQNWNTFTMFLLWMDTQNIWREESWDRNQEQNNQRRKRKKHQTRNVRNDCSYHT